MNKTRDSVPVLDLMGRALRMIKERHGAWMAEAPQTRELLAEMIVCGIREENTLVELVELSGGKGYDPKTATFH